jgi:hypothetical protein
MMVHPHVVEFEDCFEDEDNVYMVLQLCENGVSQMSLPLHDSEADDGMLFSLMLDSLVLLSCRVINDYSLLPPHHDCPSLLSVTHAIWRILWPRVEHDGSDETAKKVHRTRGTILPRSTHCSMSIHAFKQCHPSRSKTWKPVLGRQYESTSWGFWARGIDRKPGGSEEVSVHLLLRGQC